MSGFKRGRGMAKHKFRFLGILALLALGCSSGESTTSTNTAKNVGGSPTKTTLVKPTSGEAGQSLTGPAGSAGIPSGEAGVGAGGSAGVSDQGGTPSVAGSSAGGQPEAGSPGAGSTGIGGALDAAGQAGSLAYSGASNDPGGASGAGVGGSPAGAGGSVSGAAGASAGASSGGKAGTAGAQAGAAGLPAATAGSSTGGAGAAPGGAGAGGSVSGSAGVGGAPLGCTPGAKQCGLYNMNSQTCDASGQWQTTQWCTLCAGAGVCGVCIPGRTNCVGLQVQTCDATGQWQNTQTCPYVCSAGACTGSCNPGATQCSGLNAQTCSSSGQWQTTQTCPYVCSAGACTGTCTPGTVGCNGLTARSCNSSGFWIDQQVCPLACSAGTCTTCTPGATRCTGLNAQTCDGSGNWQTTQACPYVCSAGSCTGVCTPGTVSCSGTTPQTCNSSGQWVAGTACPTRAGATTTCTGAGVCGYTCNTGYTDCDGQAANGCEAQLASDSNNCNSCGHSCGGGSCSSGVCQAMTLASGLDNPYRLTTDSTSVYWKDNAALKSMPLAGGTIKSLVPYPGGYGALGANGNYMYYSGNSYNYTCNISGGNCSGNSNSNGTYAVDMKIYGGMLYYASNVKVMTAVEGHFPADPQPVYNSPNWPNGGIGGLNNVGSTLYWKDFNYSSGWTIKTMTGTGPYTPTIIASGGLLSSGCTGSVAITSTASLAVDGTYLYWLEDACISTVRTTFIKRQIIGDTSSTVNLVNLTAAGYSSATNAQMLVDGTNLYIRMTTEVGLAGVIIVNKTTGAIRQITTQTTGDITIDSTYLYWTVSLATPNGAIKRIVKN